ncbi:vomeronasal type-2 receptor 26-like [Podarcis muralis]
MVPNEAHQYMGIISLLKHFGWTWVGLFAVDDDNGEHFMQALEWLLSQNGMCSAFTQKIPNQNNMNTINEINDIVSDIYLAFTESKANTFVIYGGSMTILWLNTYVFLGFPGYKEDRSFGKVWIVTAQFDFTLTGFERGTDFQLFEGALSFKIHSNEIQGSQQFLHTIRPGWAQGDGFFKVFWEQAFDCLFPDPEEPLETDGKCTGKEKLERLPRFAFEMSMSGHSYSIYNAVYVIAHALEDMYSSTSKDTAMARGKSLEHQVLQPWKLNAFLQATSFNNSAGETLSFHNSREMEGGFDIMNVITFPNRSFQRVSAEKILIIRIFLLKALQILNLPD